MHYLLQIIGSSIVGGIIVLMILGLNFSITSTSNNNSLDAQNHENSTFLAEIIDTDFKLIGYNDNSVNPSIISIDSTSIKYKSDLDNDGDTEEVHYYLDNSAISETPNPNDVRLFRQIDKGTPLDIGIGVTKFRVWCYDKKGIKTINTSAAKMVQYEIWVESTYSYKDQITGDDTYSRACLVRTITPKNL